MSNIQKHPGSDQPVTSERALPILPSAPAEGSPPVDGGQMSHSYRNLVNWWHKETIEDLAKLVLTVFAIVGVIVIGTFLIPLILTLGSDISKFTTERFGKHRLA